MRAKKAAAKQAFVFTWYGNEKITEHKARQTRSGWIFEYIVPHLLRKKIVPVLRRLSRQNGKNRRGSARYAALPLLFAVRLCFSACSNSLSFCSASGFNVSGTCISMVT